MSPSKLLCQQIDKVLTDLTTKCSKVVKYVNLTAKSQANAQKHISQNPDIIISTPARILNFLKQDHMNFKESCETVVMDEADLLFSCGYKDDVKEILEKHLPSTYQVDLFLKLSTHYVLIFIHLILVCVSVSNVKR